MAISSLAPLLVEARPRRSRAAGAAGREGSIRGDDQSRSAALGKLLADDATYTHSNALFETKAAIHQELTSGNIDYVSIDAERIRLESSCQRQHRDRERRRGGQRDRHGKDLKIKIRYTTIHTNRGGSWQLQAWQATRFPA